jgi:SH3 domain protein
MAATSAWAETRYVIDQLIVTVRSAPNDNAEILQSIKTGEPVELLEDGKTYIKVRTQKGTVGYSLKYYYTADTPKTQVIAQLERERDRLQQQVNELQAALKPKVGEDGLTEKQRLEKALLELNQTKKSLAEVSGKFDRLTADTRDVSAVIAERDRLRQESTVLNEERSRLRQENDSLLRGKTIQWFLAGAGTLFCGWIVGRMSRKRRSGF